MITQAQGFHSLHQQPATRSVTQEFNNSASDMGFSKSAPLNVEGSFPVPFPHFSVGDCSSVEGNFNVYDPSRNCYQLISHVVISKEVLGRAYWLSSPLQYAIYGNIMHAYVLSYSRKYNRWEFTTEQKAIKVMYWSKMQTSEIVESQENPLAEVAAFQYLRHRQEPLHNVMLPDEILRDDIAIYVIMPFFRHGDLFRRLEKSSRGYFSEHESRHWFMQIINVSGVCNLKTRKTNKLLI